MYKEGVPLILIAILVIGLTPIQAVSIEDDPPVRVLLKYIDEGFTHIGDGVYVIDYMEYLKPLNRTVLVNGEKLPSEAEEFMSSHVLGSQTMKMYEEYVSSIKSLVVTALKIEQSVTVIPTIHHYNEKKDIVLLRYRINLFMDDKYRDFVEAKIKELYPVLIRHFRAWSSKAAEQFYYMTGIDISGEYRNETLIVLIADMKTEPHYIVGREVYIPKGSRVVEDPINATHLEEVLRDAMNRWPELVGHDYSFGILRIFLTAYDNPPTEEILAKATMLRREILGRDDLPIQVVLFRKIRITDIEIAPYRPAETSIQPPTDPETQPQTQEQQTPEAEEDTAPITTIAIAATTATILAALTHILRRIRRTG